MNEPTESSELDARDDRGCPHLIEAMRAVAVGNMLVRSLIAEKNGGSTFSQNVQQGGRKFFLYLQKQRPTTL